MFNPFLTAVVVGFTFALITLFASAIAGFSFAPWVPSRRRDYARALAFSELKPGEVLYDLGCGDGRFLFFAASRMSVTARGVELIFPLAWFAKLRARVFRGPGTVSVRWGDLFGTDISNADVTFLFGMPKTLAGRVRTKLVGELPSGARIISYYFPVEGLVPEAVSRDAAGRSPIYRYRIGYRE